VSTIAIPVIPVRRRIPWVLTLLIAVGVVGIAWVVMLLTGRGSDGFVAGEFVAVQPMDLDITITKDGELQAVQNVEIVNKVEGQSVILDIAKEGTYVHKGDVVVKLDPSLIEQQLEDDKLNLQKAEADVLAAVEAKAIQESTNAANLEAGNVELILARLDLQEYVEGTYPSSVQTAKTSVEMARISVKDKEDNLAQTRSLFSKGFVTSVDVKKAELELMTAQNDLDKKSTDLLVLEKYTHEKELTDRRNKVVQAEKKLTRVQRENASQLAQKSSDLNAKEQALDLRREQLKQEEEQLAACTIQAPADGMVVYATSGGGGGWGRRETPLGPGATVRQQELLIRLPDTSHMKAVARISEAQVSRLRVDPGNPVRATAEIVGLPGLIGATLTHISIMADSSSRFFSPDTKEYPVDITLDHTPQGLKPGMSATTKIFVDRLKQVMAVPLGAVYAAGQDSYVFVRSGGQTTPTKVAIGQVNETHAQITNGLTRGQQVLILQAGQGRELLEKAGIKVVTSTTQPADAVPPRPPQIPGATAGGGTPGGGGPSVQGNSPRGPGEGRPGGGSGGGAGGERRGGRSRGGDRPGGSGGDGNTGGGSRATTAPSST
jgi:HlyD family secretion protein